MDITFSCGHCGQHLVIDSLGVGDTVPCPKCGRSLTVPFTSTPLESVNQSVIAEQTVSSSDKATASIKAKTITFLIVSPLVVGLTAFLCYYYHCASTYGSIQGKWYACFPENSNDDLKFAREMEDRLRDSIRVLGATEEKRIGYAKAEDKVRFVTYRLRSFPNEIEFIPDGIFKKSGVLVSNEKGRIYRFVSRNKCIIGFGNEAMMYEILFPTRIGERQILTFTLWRLDNIALSKSCYTNKYENLQVYERQKSEFWKGVKTDTE